MARHHRWTALATVLTVATFGLAACGGGGSSVTDAVDGSDDTSEAADGGSGDADLGDISNECARAGAAFTKALESFDELSTSMASGEVSIDVDALRSDIESAREAVPNEIRGAYDTYMAAFLDYAEILNGLDPQDYADPAVLEQLTQATQAFGSAEIMEAMNALTEYFTQECGLTDVSG